MLVLTRRVGEEIIIGDSIRVSVIGVKGSNVRIGVTAPASVKVDRKEVHEQRLQFELADLEPQNGFLFYDEMAV